MASTDLSSLNYATVSDGTVYNADGTVRTAKTDGTTSSLSTATEDGTNMDYDDFLTLLCAEMQYQDPLEPASNTEYVAQLATFSQLEATLSMKTTMTDLQETLNTSLTNTQQLLENNTANNLVGKYVIIATTDDNGSTAYVDGKVDYVMYDTDGSVLVSVADGLYPLSQIDTIADQDYYEAVALSKSMENMLSQLPDAEDLTATYSTAVSQVRELYDGMTSYQQGYVSSSDLTKLEALEAKLKTLEEYEAQKAAETEESEESSSEETVSEEATETAAVEEIASEE